jgi:hypothetical protein
MTYVYVLELNNNKYYVGKTVNPNLHFNNDNQTLYSNFYDEIKSCAQTWINNYKPIKLLELIHFSSEYDENRYTFKYMKKYGIDNVRGGCFCELEFDMHTRRVLEISVNNYNYDDINDDLNNILVDDKNILIDNKIELNNNIMKDSINYTSEYNNEISKVILEKVDETKINKPEYCNCILSKLFNHKRCIKYYLGYSS